MEISRVDEDATEVDFEPVHEDWNVYQLSDGSVLRIRPIVFKVFNTHQMTIEGTPVIGIASTNIISARVPDSLRKKELPEGEPTSEERTEIDFEASREVWNKFKVEGDLRLKVKIVMSRVVRTSKYNRFGEPIYIVSSGNVANVQVVDKTD